MKKETIPIGNYVANPFTIFSFFSLLIFFDFFYLSFSDVFYLRGRFFHLTDVEKMVSSGYYFLLFLSLSLGIIFSSKNLRKSSSRKVENNQTGPRDRQVIGILAGGLVVLSIAIFMMINGVSTSIADISASKSLNALEIPIIPVISWSSTIAFGLFINVTKLDVKKMIYLTALVGLISLATGARIHAFMLLIFLASALHNKGLNLKYIYMFVMIIPGLILLTLYRYYLRAVSNFSGTFSEFIVEKGGPVGVIFASEEMSSAEIFSVGFSQLQDNLSRFPFEGLMGLLLMPIPRSFLGEIKPEPFSSGFTNYISPDIWISSKSQLVTGSFLELEIEFGMFVAPLILFIIGIIYGALAVRIWNVGKVPYFWFACLNIGMFLFLRTDIFNMALFLWPLLIVTSMWKVLTMQRRPMAMNLTKGRLAN